MERNESRTFETTAILPFRINLAPCPIGHTCVHLGRESSCADSREESAGIMLDSQWDKARQHGCEIIEAAAMQNFGGPVSIV